MSEDLVNIEVDGQPLKARRGAMLIEVTDIAGIYIPRFCYHKKLSVAANCRMCLVEVERAPKPQPACATPVMEGMKVFTKSEKAVHSQKAVMEFLLINHPLDCPVCDQGGECELQDLAMGYGSDVSQFVERKRVVKEKDIGSLIQTDMTRCIHCTRCVRFGDEIGGLRELGATGRGEHMEIGTYVRHAMTSELSGNIIDLCPVGALTSKPFRYSARPWELQQRAGIAPHDCLGSNVYLHVKGQVVKRVVPCENEHINETWLSDRDRFAYEGLRSEDRLLTPRVRRDGEWQDCDWEVAFEFAAAELSAAADASDARLAALAAPSSTSEEFFLLQRLIRGLGSNDIDHRLRQRDFSDDAREPPIPGFPFEFDELERADAILVVGGYPRHDQPLLNHRLRKAALGGARIFAIDSYAQPYNFDLDARITVPPSEIGAVLAAIAAAAERKEEQASAAPDPGGETAAAARRVAGALSAAERAYIIAACAVERSAYRSDWLDRCATIAALTDGRLGQLTDGANAAGAWLAGAVPHRGPAGVAVANPGRNGQVALRDGSDAYLLLGIEPERDFADVPAAVAALGRARTVIALAAFASPALLATADVLLPVAAFGENEGSFINATGRWQDFAAAVKPPGEARAAWKVLRVLGERLGLDGFDAISVAAVGAELKALTGDWQPRARSSGTAAAPPPRAAAAATGLELLDVLPLYAGDALVRRAPGLQATSGVADDRVRVAYATASALGLVDGSPVVVSVGDAHATAELVVDDAVAPRTCVIHVGSTLLAQLPMSTHVRLEGAR